MRGRTLKSIAQLLASTRLALLGIALLALGALFSYDNPDAPLWLLIAPLFLLAINLTSALFVNSRIRQNGGLLLFHLALLGVILLVGAGYLMRFDGRVEVTEGSVFSFDDAESMRRGPLHPFRLNRVHFAQGAFSVDYIAGLNRSVTRSHVFVPGTNGQPLAVVVGDSTPLLLEGYRFYTTPNKGFAPLITWTPDGGQPSSGTVNMPAYPKFEWLQKNRWTPPGRTEIITFELHVKTNYSESADWILDGKSRQTTLTLISANRSVDLNPGDTTTLPGGHLRFDELRTWMGYNIYYDPTLPWLFYIAVLGVSGLAWHYWRNSTRAPFTTGAVPSESRSLA